MIRTGKQWLQKCKIKFIKIKVPFRLPVIMLRSYWLIDETVFFVDFFFNSWRVYLMEHVCINLAIFWESL